jgi:hypothetical protein
MDCYTDEDWVDFARHVGNGEKRQAMEEHLKSGCEACQASLRFWDRTARSAALERSYESPSHLVRSVKGLGALHLPQTERSPIVEIAQLMLNSALPSGSVGKERDRVA